jgi:hypothetical protein
MARCLDTLARLGGGAQMMYKSFLSADCHLLQSNRHGFRNRLKCSLLAVNKIPLMAKPYDGWSVSKKRHGVLSVDKHAVFRHTAC